MKQVPVTTAAEAAELDAHTIASGVPSGELMRRAATAAVGAIEREYGDGLRTGVYVATGPGNNGGDGWLVAALLARKGVRVTVSEAVDARSSDARAARAEAEPNVAHGGSWSGEGLVVDALLGTGATGEARGAIADAVSELARARDARAATVALDMPTGVDASTGAAFESVHADLTITFGSVKRGHLAARDRCGRIVTVDIGLLEPAESLPELITSAHAFAWVPPISFSSHKGSRGGVSIIGGGTGMAGAAILAAHGALRSGAGSARICVSDEHVTATHSAVPAALVTTWSRVLSDVEKYLGSWPEAIVCGCGLGTDDTARQLLERTLDTWTGPLVLDADALNLLAGRVREMHDRLRARSDSVRAVLTPHPAEMKRLLSDGTTTAQASEQRYELAPQLAREAGAVALLKGVPTVIASPDGRRRVSATGTPALATGGAGDVLAGMIGTLLAQKVDPFDAASAGAWFHGRAAELATGESSARGTTISDVVERLKDVWTAATTPLPEGVLAELPRLA